MCGQLAIYHNGILLATGHPHNLWIVQVIAMSDISLIHPQALQFFPLEKLVGPGDKGTMNYLG